MKNEQLSFFGENIRIPKKGIEHEVRTEKSIQKKTKKGRKRVAYDGTYAEFYREGLQLDENIFRQYEEKLKLLTNYFPAQFGTNGIEILKEKTARDIGSRFNRLMDYSKKRTGQ